MYWSLMGLVFGILAIYHRHAISSHVLHHRKGTAILSKRLRIMERLSAPAGQKSYKSVQIKQIKGKGFERFGFPFSRRPLVLAKRLLLRKNQVLKP